MEEEAWNAYPYTKTRYTCPFVEKFSLEIETYYFADNGHQENVFKLTGSDLRNRIIGNLNKLNGRIKGAQRGVLLKTIVIILFNFFNKHNIYPKM